MSKIIVLTTSLSIGGITSFLIPLVNLLSDEGHEVTLAYTKDYGVFLNRIRSNVKTLQYKLLSHKQIIKAWCRNFAFYDMARIYLRKNTQVPHYASIQRLGYISAKYVNITDDMYDIAISTSEGFCNYIVANKICANKKIGWIHPDMVTLGLDIKAGQKILNKLDYVVAVSESGCQTLKRFFPKDKQKIFHIENMMDSDNINIRAQEFIQDMPLYEGGLNIVTVCRITNESKRLDRVIKVAEILKEKKFKFRWYIVGDGSDFEMMTNLIRNKNLQSEIIMLGGRNNPLPYIKQADCFVLTSQFEGKPVVIEEAKILHTPVIVTEYSSAKIQVTPNVGIVVSNVDGILESEISRILMDDKILNNLKNSCRGFKYDNMQSVDQIKKIIK